MYLLTFCFQNEREKSVVKRYKHLYKKRPNARNLRTIDISGGKRNCCQKRAGRSSPEASNISKYEMFRQALVSRFQIVGQLVHLRT